MPITLDTLREYVHDLYGELDTYDEGRQRLSFCLYPQDTRLICFIDVLSEGSVFILTAYPQHMSPVVVTPQQEEAVIDGINQINTRSHLGRWAIRDNGVLSWRYTWLLEDSEFTRRQMASVFFVLFDQVPHEANALQVRRRTGLDVLCVPRAISCTVVDAILMNPSAVRDICEATGQSKTCSETLYHMVGETYVADEAEGSPSGAASGLPVTVLN